MACLSGNTNSDFNNSWTPPDALWFTVWGQCDSGSRVQSHAEFLHAGSSFPFDRHAKTCSPRVQAACTLFSVIVKLVKMAWIFNRSQDSCGGKLHRHGLGLINQVKWWHRSSLACSMSLKICHWLQASGDNQHWHVFQLWSPPPSNTVKIKVGMPSIRAPYDGLRLGYLKQYTEQESTGDANSNRFFKIREIVLVVNHPKVFLTPTENRRQCSYGPRFPRIFFSFHASDPTFWPKHNSKLFVFFLGSQKERMASSAKGSIAFQRFPYKLRPDGPNPGSENIKPSQSYGSGHDSFFLFEELRGYWASTNVTQCNYVWCMKIDPEKQSFYI